MRTMRGIVACLALALCACAAPTMPAGDGGRARSGAAPAAAPHAAVPASPPASIPALFRGEWQADPARCGAALDDSRLWIGPDALQYHESRGPVRAVVANGRHELALIVELSGEGETWLKTEHFRLSPDLDELSSLGGDGTPFVRHRCGPALR